MKNKIKISIIVLICLAIVPSFVFAFGEVTGPVVINAPIGGSGVGSWGLGNNETVKVSLRAEGDAAKYLSFPSEVTLPSTGIYWVNVTANIPSDYNVSQGTNITGVMYAVLEGSPGQVKINLQLEKKVYILVEEPQASNLSSGNFLTGLFALESTSAISAVGLALIVIVALIYFMKNKKGGE